IIVGGIIEAPVNHCTHNLAYRLSDLKIPATFDFKPTGTHSWNYWQDDLHNSWPMIARSMDI
ncbi:esterase, partial [Rhodococcus sp. SRB_17]|nr:esterase [Rhodococcus sp. SRB_17]